MNNNNKTREKFKKGYLNRRELALMEVEKARKHLELVFKLLYKEDELEEIGDYYNTIDAKLIDLKHEIEWLEKDKKQA